MKDWLADRLVILSIFMLLGTKFSRGDTERLYESRRCKLTFINEPYTILSGLADKAVL